MVTTLEDLSVELFYEIFIYFQLHEIWATFSNLNSRITGIIENHPSISVYLGSSGMNIEVTNFYYKYLSQRNICTHLTSLCVSDTSSIGNGRWFAEHGSTFINLRHLSLIDIERSSFEIILDSLSPIHSLIVFSVNFVATDDRVASTFQGVPEGVYREEISRLFPSLRECHLLFGQYLRYTIDSHFIPPSHRWYMPIQRNLLNLQSLTLQYCSPRFLSDLFEHLPQLKQFSCLLFESLWIPEEHLLEHDSKNQCTVISKRLAPNLRRLKINWVGKVISVKSIEMLFEYDVLFSLAHFTLLAQINHLDVLRNVLSKLSCQCCYRFDVTWYVMDEVSISDTSNILSNALEQLKGPMPIELELRLKRDSYSVRAMTLPRKDVCLSVDSYLRENIFHAQSRWPYNKHNLNNRQYLSNQIWMSNRYDQTNGEFLSLSPNIICWDRVTSMNILQPLNSTYLHVLFSQAIHLRILSLEYIAEFARQNHSNDKILIDLINDQSLCNILMSNSLRQLNLLTGLGQRNLINLAHLIVERLPYLEAIEVNSDNVELIEMPFIFINGLSKLSFVALSGCLEIYSIYYNEIPLCDSMIRSFRMEMSAVDPNKETLLIWL